MILHSALNRLIKKLDKRHAEQQRHGQFKFKTRVLSHASQLEAPADHPDRAVQLTSLDTSVEHSINNSSVYSES